MFGPFPDGRCITQGATGVDQLIRAQGRPATLTLITVSIRVTTYWTGAYDISVGQKGLFSLIVELLRFLFFKQPLVIELQKECRSRFMVDPVGRPGLDIE